jgi:hypothetical protein
MRRAVRVPLDVIAFREHAACFLDVNDLSWRLTGILVRLCELQASIKKLEAPQPCKIITTALEMDDEFSSLSASMPAEWQFNSIFTNAGPQLVYIKTYHIYPDLWVAHIWNSIRILRITLHQIICAQMEAIQFTASFSTLATNQAQKKLLDCDYRMNDI